MKRFLHLLTGICTLALALQACTKSPAENPGRTDDPGNDEQNSKVTLTLSTPRTRTTLVSETYVHWSEEDIVQINGTNLPVIPDPNDPTRATISNVDTAEEYVALYSPDNGGYIPEREVVEAYFRPEVPHTPDSFYSTGGNPRWIRCPAGRPRKSRNKSPIRSLAPSGEIQRRIIEHTPSKRVNSPTVITGTSYRYISNIRLPKPKFEAIPEQILPPGQRQNHPVIPTAPLSARFSETRERP